MQGNQIRNGAERLINENLLDHNREALYSDCPRSLRSPSPASACCIADDAYLTDQACSRGKRTWFQRFCAGLEESECDGYSRRDEGTFPVTDDESLADDIAEFERASQKAREIAAGFDLDDTKDNPQEGAVSMRWTLLAMIQEFVRHAGHGDILREQIDGPTPRNLRAGVETPSPLLETGSDDFSSWNETM